MTDSSITFKLKCVNPSDQDLIPDTLTLSSDSFIKDIKEAIQQKNGVDIDEMKLIYKGKVLDNNHTLAFYKIEKDHVIVYLRTKKKAVTASASEAQGISSSPTAAPATPSDSRSSVPVTPPTGARASPMSRNPFGLSGSEAARGGLGNGMDMRAMLNSPMMQNMLNNPEMMRNIMRQMPGMQELIESNPEMGRILNDPEMMRQYVEMMANPNMRAEMERNQDLMLSRLDTIPGANNYLRQMYSSMEPLRNRGSRPSPNSGSTSGTEESKSNEENQETQQTNPWQTTPPTQAPNPFGGLGNFGLSGASPEEQRNIMQGLMRPENMQLAMQLMQNLGLGPGAGGANGMGAGVPDFGSMFGMPPPRTAMPPDNRPPEERFATQLGQLENMGFVNREDNIRALVATNGNVNLAVERLLGAGM